MFDVGFWELTIIGVVALVIVGPERLPGLARTAGLWVGKGRRMLADVKRDIDREIKASEVSDLGDLKKDIEDASKEVSKASEAIKAESGVDDLKDTFKDASPLKDDITADIKEEIDEIDQVSKEFDDQLTSGTESTADAVDEQAKAAAGVDEPVASETREKAASANS